MSDRTCMQCAWRQSTDAPPHSHPGFPATRHDCRKLGISLNKYGVERFYCPAWEQRKPDQDMRRVPKEGAPRDE